MVLCPVETTGWGLDETVGGDVEAEVCEGLVTVGWVVRIVGPAVDTGGSTAAVGGGAVGDPMSGGGSGVAATGETGELVMMVGGDMVSWTGGGASEAVDEVEGRWVSCRRLLDLWWWW